jgi:hypothetical protein
MARTITQKNKRKAKERSKDAQLARIKEEKELVPHVVKSYLTHHLSNVAFIHIMRSNRNRRFRTSIFNQTQSSIGQGMLSCIIFSCPNLARKHTCYDNILI